MKVRRWLRAAGVGRVLNAAVRLLPPGIQRSYEHLKARAGFGRAAPLSSPVALERSYRGALELLVSSEGSDGIGDYVEFGVYAGSSMVCMHRALESLGLHDVRLIGFDSFEGLPQVAEVEGAGRWVPGEFHSPMAFTEWNLTRSGVPTERVTLIPGWFDATATEETAMSARIGHLSVVLIDCDLYSSAQTALEFCAPRLGPTSIIFFDEWSVGEPGAAGFDERRAFTEFRAAHPEFHTSELVQLGRYKADSRAFLVTRSP